MNNAKKERKAIECERLKISSRKWEISRQHFMQGMGMMKDRSNKDLIRSRRD